MAVPTESPTFTPAPEAGLELAFLMSSAEAEPEAICSARFAFTGATAKGEEEKCSTDQSSSSFEGMEIDLKQLQYRYELEVAKARRSGLHFFDRCHRLEHPNTH